ncbi:MAG: IPT/TIG domain-containing protein [Candidatus Paceibacterota bacterium]
MKNTKIFLLVVVNILILGGLVYLIIVNKQSKQSFSTDQRPSATNFLLEQSKTLKEYGDGYNYKISVPVTYDLKHEPKDKDNIHLVDLISIRGPGSGSVMYISVQNQPLDITGRIYNNVKDLVPFYKNTNPRQPLVKYLIIDGIEFAKLTWEDEKMMLAMKDGFIYEMIGLDKEDGYLKIAESLRFYPPVISSIFPESGPVGTVVTLKGNNLSGENGSLDAWIENEKGEIGYVGHVGETIYPESNQINFQFKDIACKQAVVSEDCVDYFRILPGNYKIFTQPWGKKSNTINFKVTSR